MRPLVAEAMKMCTSITVSAPVAQLGCPSQSYSSLQKKCGISKFLVLKCHRCRKVYPTPGPPGAQAPSLVNEA
jgi:hypothetical protein